jgi:chromosome segregation ATPase
MTSLHETLAVLSEQVPEIVPEVAKLLEEGERLEKAVQELLQEFEEKRAAADSLAGRARAALAELKEVGLQQTQQLDAAMASLESAVDRFAQGLLSAEEGLAAEVQAAGGALETLSGQLTAGGTTVREAHDGGEGAVGELGGVMETSLGELRGAFDTASEQAAALGQAVTDAQALVEGELQDLREKMTGLLASANTAVGEMLGGIRARQASHEGTLQGAAGDLATGKDTLLGDLRERLTQEVQTRVGTAIENASLALDGLADEARGANETVAAARRELEAGLESVEEAKSPLPGAVQQVRVAADGVGLNWA